jgi:biopolymer transport protein ExbD
MILTVDEERKVVKKAELSFTPMIDVIFLLLIFFLYTMKFRELDRRLEADLPKQGQEAETELLDEIWIFVQNGGTAAEPEPRIIIDQRRMRGWKETYSTLERLARVPKARQDPVLLVPDGNAQHGWVMKVLDILNQLGYRNINFKQ